MAAVIAPFGGSTAVVKMGFIQSHLFFRVSTKTFFDSTSKRQVDKQKNIGFEHVWELQCRGECGFSSGVALEAN